MAQITTRLHTFVFALVVAVLACGACLFTVDQTEQAIVLRFGNPIKVHSTPGLKIKMPWPIENVVYFDKRILDVDPPAERVHLASDERAVILQAPAATTATTAKPVEQTRAQEFARNRERTGSIPLIVDTFARYRIVDPLLFLQRMGTEINAQSRIESVMNAATRDVLGKATLSRLLSSGRVTLMNQIRDRVNAEMKDRGVAIVDIRIVRADLTEQLSDSTVNRMVTERREEATEARAQGQEKAQEIRSTADKERTIILAEANRKAEVLRGTGDKEALQTITAAANQDPDFYAFIKTMFAYRNTLASPDTNLVLSPDSAFLRYLKTQKAPQ